MPDTVMGENAIIEKVAALCSTLDGVAAIVLVGSRARGVLPELADDWDLLAIMRAETIPEEARRQRLWLSPESPVARAEIHFGGCNDRFVLPAGNIGIDYNRNVPLVQNLLNRVLELGKVERTASPWWTLGECPEVVCADFGSAVPRWDPDGIVAAWKTRVSPYPQQFRVNLIHACLFEARFHLVDLRRGVELRDIPLLHAALSETILCLLRILFALNRRWFPGLKYAMAITRDFIVVPKDWRDDLERLLRQGLPNNALGAVHAQAESLTLRLARAAAEQGEEEREAVNHALGEWPDVDPLDLNRGAGNADQPRLTGEAR